MKPLLMNYWRDVLMSRSVSELNDDLDAYYKYFPLIVSEISAWRKARDSEHASVKVDMIMSHEGKRSELLGFLYSRVAL